MLADSIPKGDIAFQRRTTTTTTRGARFEPLKCFYSSLNEETNSFDLHTTSIACASHPRHDSTRGNSTPPPIGSYHIPFASVAHISHFDTLVLPSEGCAAKRVFIAFSAQSSRASELFLLQSTLAAAAAPRAASDATGRACRMVRVALDQEIGCSSNRRLMAVDSHLSITSIRALHGIGFLISFGESQQQQVSLLPLRSLKILFNNPIDLQHSANSSANLSSPNAATLLHTIQLYPSKLVNASEACVEPTEGGSVCRFSDSCCSRRLFSSTTQCLKKLWRKVVEDGAVDEIVQGGFILALGTYLSDKHLQIFILNSNLDLLNYNLDSSGSIRLIQLENIAEIIREFAANQISNSHQSFKVIGMSCSDKYIFISIKFEISFNFYKTYIISLSRNICDPPLQSDGSGHDLHIVDFVRCPILDPTMSIGHDCLIYDDVEIMKCDFETDQVFGKRTSFKQMITLSDRNCIEDVASISGLNFALISGSNRTLIHLDKFYYEDLHCHVSNLIYSLFSPQIEEQIILFIESNCSPSRYLIDVLLFQQINYQKKFDPSKVPPAIKSIRSNINSLVDKLFELEDHEISAQIAFRILSALFGCHSNSINPNSYNDNQEELQKCFAIIFNGVLLSTCGKMYSNSPSFADPKKSLSHVTKKICDDIVESIASGELPSIIKVFQLMIDLSEYFGINLDATPNESDILMIFGKSFIQSKFSHIFSSISTQFSDILIQFNQDSDDKIDGNLFSLLNIYLKIFRSDPSNEFIQVMNILFEKSPNQSQYIGICLDNKLYDMVVQFFVRQGMYSNIAKLLIDVPEIMFETVNYLYKMGYLKQLITSDSIEPQALLEACKDYPDIYAELLAKSGDFKSAFVSLVNYLISFAQTEGDKQLSMIEVQKLFRICNAFYNCTDCTEQIKLTAFKKTLDNFETIFDFQKKELATADSDQFLFFDQLVKKILVVFADNQYDLQLLTNLVELSVDLDRNFENIEPEHFIFVCQQFVWHLETHGDNSSRIWQLFISTLDIDTRQILVSLCETSRIVVGEALNDVMQSC